MELPQRALGVQRRRGELSHPVLQGLLFAPLGYVSQCFHNNVLVDVELAVRHPGGATRVLHHPLGETRVLEQALLNARAHGRMAHTGFEHPHAHNHHQVGGGVHAQPGGVDLAHALAAQAQGAPQGVGNVFAYGAGRPRGCLLGGFSGSAAGGFGANSGDHGDSSRGRTQRHPILRSKWSVIRP
jgi:hypothetical protein